MTSFLFSLKTRKKRDFGEREKPLFPFKTVTETPHDLPRGIFAQFSRLHSLLQKPQAPMTDKEESSTSVYKHFGNTYIHRSAKLSIFRRGFFKNNCRYD
jgi:hypothetical protein